MLLAWSVLHGCVDDGQGPRPRPRATVAPARWSVGHDFAGAPLVVDVVVPWDLVGAGLPEDLVSGRGPDRSLVQLEVPVGYREGGETEEEPGPAHFEDPAFCWPDDAACLAGPPTGRWTASGIGPTGEVPLVIGHPRRVRTPDGRDEVLRKELAVWAPEGARLPAGRPLRLRYEGRGPVRATPWTPLALHLRVRRGEEWVSVEDVTPVEIEAGPAAFVTVRAPLDAAPGPVTAAVVVTDRYGNPSPVEAEIDVAPAGPVALDGWRAEVTIDAVPGDVRWSATLPGARSIPQWTRVGTGPVRRVADLHVHTGQGAPTPFAPSFQPGDHAGGHVPLADAARYAAEVAGLDVVAFTEHAVRDPLVPLPAGVAEDAAFDGAGCGAAVRPIEGQAGWWDAATAAVDALPPGGPLVLRGYEWFPTAPLPLHRVVLVRDPAPPPLLWSYGRVDSPHCLLRFLAAAGLGPRDATIVPHLMRASDRNDDWAVAYDAPVAADRAEVEAWQRVAEVFSARNHNERLPSDGALALFEVGEGRDAPYALRTAWRDHAAHVGVLGASDDHHGMPGLDDPAPLEGAPWHRGSAGGVAVLVAEGSDRDAVFDALLDRSTYATSGPRAWLSFTADGEGMGSELAATGPVTLAAELLAPLPIAEVSVFAARVGGGEPWTRVWTASPGGEVWRGRTEVGPLGPGEWVLYLRASLLPPPGGNPDAVWSSPVWITW